ncbi:MAG: carboxypeptidase-like regulatory domain-containing protein [Bacteroidales bacterium]
MLYRIFIFTFFFFGFPFVLGAQVEHLLQGKVLDYQDKPINNAHIAVENHSVGAVTDSQGFFQVHLPEEASPNDSVIVSHVGYQGRTVSVEAFMREAPLIIRLMKAYQSVGEVEVKGILQMDQSLRRIDKRDFEMLPAAAGEVESIIKNMPGVASGNELSHQYSVRGGNYDENLVYVNGVEIYRPLLVRSGKQEGLSFLNPDMVSSLHFSAGGYEPRYGDKMASVLDIRYNKPSEFSGNMEMSLLGASVHLEDKIGERFTYNSGFRYKTNQYLLNSLDVEGHYKPNFYDLQTYLTYAVTDQFDLEFLGNCNLNRYSFVPQSRETSFGTIGNVLNMKIYYEGQEVDDFKNYLGALAGNYHPFNDLQLRFIASAYKTVESETYDILGEYYLNELDKNTGSQTYGDSIMNIGVGGYLNHARNFLEGKVYTFSHKGRWSKGNNLLKWGVKFKRESIRDKSNEWQYVDSAGYSVPYFNSAVNFHHSLRADNSLNSSRFTSYLQNTFHLTAGYGDWFFNAGLRTHYWDFNEEFLISPRINVGFEPLFSNNLRFYSAGGYYYQPPFYKEMKMNNGKINPDIRAQKSLHIVVGSEYDFRGWGRAFKFTAECYYKPMDRLIPYKIDNVRIDYAGKNMARGYSTGIDMKINGEFVEGVESWASLSIMQSKADIKGDSYINEKGEEIKPGYYPRPTSQLLNFSMFFQDYIPNYPSYKLQLSAHYGSPLPFSPPNTERYDKVFRMPSYRRVDVGFSKLIRGSKDQSERVKLLRYIESFWVGVEVFNLLDINNTISYQWIKVVSNQQGKSGQYAVPNYLTSRRVNVKLVIEL